MKEFENGDGAGLPAWETCHMCKREHETRRIEHEAGVRTPSRDEHCIVEDSAWRSDQADAASATDRTLVPVPLVATVEIAEACRR